MSAIVPLINQSQPAIEELHHVGSGLDLPPHIELGHSRQFLHQGVPDIWLAVHHPLGLGHTPWSVCHRPGNRPVSRVLRRSRGSRRDRRVLTAAVAMHRGHTVCPLRVPRPSMPRHQPWYGSDWRCIGPTPGLISNSTPMPSSGSMMGVCEQHRAIDTERLIGIRVAAPPVPGCGQVP